MSEFPETSESLIGRVRDRTNHAAWFQFERIYRPVIFRIARAKGLQYADALDLVQQVLLSVASAIHRYEKRDETTRFRNWLSKVTRNAILKALSRAPRDRAAGGSSVVDILSEVPAEDPETATLIDLEYRRELFHRAADAARCAVEESTWLAFELTVLQNMSVERAAASLNVSTGSVYAARSRIMRRIRDAVCQLKNSDYEDAGHETHSTNV